MIMCILVPTEYSPASTPLGLIIGIPAAGVVIIAVVVIVVVVCIKKRSCAQGQLVTLGHCVLGEIHILAIFFISGAGDDSSKAR